MNNENTYRLGIEMYQTSHIGPFIWEASTFSAQISNCNGYMVRIRVRFELASELNYFT